MIRHELVHIFNLEQTKFQVPHWFTEGLAVRYEGPNIPPTLALTSSPRSSTTTTCSISTTSCSASFARGRRSSGSRRTCKACCTSNT